MNSVIRGLIVQYSRTSACFTGQLLYNHVSTGVGDDGGIDLEVGRGGHSYHYLMVSLSTGARKL